MHIYRIQNLYSTNSRKPKYSVCIYPLCTTKFLLMSYLILSEVFQQLSKLKDLALYPRAECMLFRKAIVHLVLVFFYPS